LAFAGCSAPSLPSRGRAKEPYQYVENYGESVILRNGRAIAPRHAPAAVHRLVAAGNRLQGKPYLYGGGHARVEDRGYDCSGTVSYALIHAGKLGSPMPSRAFRKFGNKGAGKWVTVYAKDGHTFLTVGGLRLDTGYRGDGRGPTWETRQRPTSGYLIRHPAGL
jgi:cell wall-associated NlpC family hydrolase